MAVIALMSCTKSKQNYPCAAKQLYAKSHQFRCAYEYAELVADKIYVLSARHGLVDVDEVIEPYDETLKDKNAEERQKWASKVTASLAEVSDLEKDHYVILAGKIYYDKLLPNLKNTSLPLEGVSLFNRPAALRKLINKEQPGGKELSSVSNNKKVTSKDIANFIDSLLHEARADGRQYLELVSGDIHKQLGLKNRMPQVCDAMYKKMGSKDEIIKTTPSGKSSTIAIKYHLG